MTRCRHNPTWMADGPAEPRVREAYAAGRTFGPNVPASISAACLPHTSSRVTPLTTRWRACRAYPASRTTSSSAPPELAPRSDPGVPRADLGDPRAAHPLDVRGELLLELGPPGRITVGSTRHDGPGATSATAASEVPVVVIAGAPARPPEASDGARNPENDRHRRNGHRDRYHPTERRGPAVGRRRCGVRQGYRRAAHRMFLPVWAPRGTTVMRERYARTPVIPDHRRIAPIRVRAGPDVVLRLG
jgi:hypothetical protein